MSYFRLKPFSTDPSSFTFCDLLRLSQPPMRYTPEVVAQDTWCCILCLRVCDWFQVPEDGLHLTQVVSAVPGAEFPPQDNPPSWLWVCLSSGNVGSEQLVFVTGLKISVDLRRPSPQPPVIKATNKKVWVQIESLKLSFKLSFNLSFKLVGGF